MGAGGDSHPPAAAGHEEPLLRLQPSLAPAAPSSLPAAPPPSRPRAESQALQRPPPALPLPEPPLALDTLGEGRRATAPALPSLRLRGHR